MNNSHPPNQADSPGDRVAILKDMLKMSMLYLEPEFCAAVSLNPLKGEFHKSPIATCALPKHAGQKNLPRWMADVADEAIKNQSVWLEKISDKSVQSFQHDSALKSLRYMSALPLYTKRERQPVAVLFLGFAHKKSFSQEEHAILSHIAERFEPLLEGAWLLGRYQAIIATGQKINQELQGPEAILKQIYRESSSVLDTSYFISLSVYHAQTRRFEHHRYYKGHYTRGETDFKGACAHVIETERAFITSHYSEDSLKPGFPPTYQIYDDDTQPAEFMAFIPLFYQKEPLGVLSIQHEKPDAFDQEDIQIIKLLANQVALALNYLRLLDYMEQVNQSGKLLIHPIRAESNLLKEVINHIRDATKSDLVILYPYRFVSGLPTESCFEEAVETGDLRKTNDVKLEVRADDMANIALRKAVESDHWETWAPDSKNLYEQLGGKPEYRQGNFECREEISSTATLVLKAGTEPVGVLFVNYRESQTFDRLQKLLINTLAHFAAIAIKNHQALQILRSADFQVLQRVDQKIGQTFELSEIMATILELAVKHVSANDAAIYLHDKRTNTLWTAATRGTNEHLYSNSRLDLSKLRRKRTKGLVATAFFGRFPILENDVRRSTVYDKVVPGTKSELDVPLIDPVTGEAVGVINLESSSLRAFNEAHRDFMITLAGQAVVAVKNAQIYQRVTNLNSSVAALLDISREVVSRQVAPKAAFVAILEKAREFFRVEIVILQLYDAGLVGQSYTVKDRTPEVYRRIQYVAPNKGKLGIIQYVAKTRKHFLTNDTGTEKLYKGSKIIRSELAVPLVFEKDLIGVLDLESISPGAFGEDDVSLLELFATQAVLVVQGAKRLLEARSTAELDLRRLELLSEAAHDLNSINEPEQIDLAYDIVVRKVNEFNNGEIIIRRYLAANREFHLVRVLNEYEVSPRVIPEEGSWNGRVRRERQVIAEQNLDDLPSEVPRPIGRGVVKSIVLAPIEFADAYYGNLIIGHKEPNVFKLSDVYLVKVMAAQLGVTLKRLEIVKSVRDTEKSNREMSVLSNVGKVAMTISHDLSNALAPVQLSTATLVNLVQKHLPKHLPRRAKLISQANEAARIINEKMKNASDFTQTMKETFSSARVYRSAPEFVSVKMLLEGIASKYRSTRGVKVLVSARRDLGVIQVSPALLMSVFDYLISNAKEAMGSVGTVTINASNQPKEVLISVTDKGPGIKHSLHEAIFQFGYTTKSGEKKGTGFGLWHAREIIESYKGTLEVRSKPGHGATFIVRLPLVNKKEALRL